MCTIIVFVYCSRLHCSLQRRGTMISAISVVLKFAIFQNMETTTTSIEENVTKLILNYSLNAIPGSFYVWA